MKKHEFKVFLKCSVCGQDTEDFLILSEFNYSPLTGCKYEDGRHWSADFADHRHTTCEQQHGSFREMVDEYRVLIKDDWLEAENFVKQNRKRGDFDVAIEPKIIEILDAELALEIEKNKGISPVQP